LPLSKFREQRAEQFLVLRFFAKRMLRKALSTTSAEVIVQLRSGEPSIARRPAGKMPALENNRQLKP